MCSRTYIACGLTWRWDFGCGLKGKATKCNTVWFYWSVDGAVESWWVLFVLPVKSWCKELNRQNYIVPYPKSVFSNFVYVGPRGKVNFILNNHKRENLVYNFKMLSAKLVKDKDLKLRLKNKHKTKLQYVQYYGLLLVVVCHFCLFCVCLCTKIYRKG